MDGSFPSRVLDYMYLGNLGHANNPELLRSLGIGQILSVGEMSMWRDGELEQWGTDNVLKGAWTLSNVADAMARRPLFIAALAYRAVPPFALPR
ncbi:Dual specificity protein phosphatase PPS1 like [Verticillium longisporum]|nr:Dual specificity protein phosphatase PPS1 like [Verticillium longisporum]